MLDSGPVSVLFSSKLLVLIVRKNKLISLFAV